ncbi:hypothetical protein AArcSl_3089 [Halalkaliarchaeum desulfuricum]|uniref:Uncharacterized protein n=1 Tax=Halalkaliarchaeum desulfuricum TaxID=2055893 RepID=A0A343TNM4_9EURY|nr:hypothetical protein [Halalkaliarchaeum desulfuricum]AUX10696.1 hypothetical protein AArcSl_3089 [Halalkaliarchaeum desulfuricum]
MADDKSGREKQARNADKRQRVRDIAAELERWDETEPEIDTAALAEFDSDLDSLDFPATGAEIVGRIGDREVEAADSMYTVEELVPETDALTFDSPSTLRVRVQRPTVAAAMKRVVEASEQLSSTDLSESQREAYEKTFRALKAIDADDDDEGIQAISDWIVDWIRDEEILPGSRAVRRQAAKFCRSNGYEIQNDNWLGI